MPNIERVLVAADDSPNGQLSSTLAGLLAGVEHLSTTVLEFAGPKPKRNKPVPEKPGAVAKSSAGIGYKVTKKKEGKDEVKDEPPIEVEKEDEKKELSEPHPGRDGKRV